MAAAHGVLGNAILYLKGDDKDLDKSLKKAEKSTQSMMASISKISTNVGKGMTVAGGAILGVAGVLVNMGANAVESENLFTVSMGRMSDSARGWSKELGRTIKRDSYSIREYLGTFNVMLTSMGQGEEAAYGMAKGLTELTYDLSSFYNVSEQDMFSRLQSAITGNSEAMKQLGINLNQAAIAETMHQMGIRKKWQELTEAERVEVRYQAILQRTTQAQGDATRTADDTKNMMRGIRDQVSELGKDMGQKLLPMVDEMLRIVSPMLQALANWVSNNEKLAASLLVGGTALGGFLFAVGPVLIALPQMVGALRTVISLGPQFWGVLKGWTGVAGVAGGAGVWGFVGALGAVVGVAGLGWAFGRWIDSITANTAFGRWIDSMMDGLVRLKDKLLEVLQLKDGADPYSDETLQERRERLGLPPPRGGYQSAGAGAVAGLGRSMAMAQSALRHGGASAGTGGASGSGGGVSVNVNMGEVHVRDDGDIRRLAKQMALEISALQRRELLKRGVS